MARYKGKPLVVEAIRWNGGNTTSVLSFLDMHGHGPLQIIEGDIQIETLEGVTLVSIGDWIIKDSKAGFYAYKPALFAACYELIQDGNNQYEFLGANHG